MPVKRRNHGRRKMGRGSNTPMQCGQCSAIVAKDKAISRSSNNPVIENALLDDLNVATIFDRPDVPTFFNMETYCVSCACSMKVVRVRRKTNRKVEFTGKIKAE